MKGQNDSKHIAPTSNFRKKFFKYKISDRLAGTYVESLNGQYGSNHFFPNSNFLNFENRKQYSLLIETYIEALNRQHGSNRNLPNSYFLKIFEIE